MPHAVSARSSRSTRSTRSTPSRRSSRTPDTVELGGVESENHPWRIQLVKHPDRFESTFFRAAKSATKKILEELDDEHLPYGPRPTGTDHWEMHHGGSLWVKGENGWRMYRARVGIEWSMQFCADPAKVDRLRQEAAELVAAFPLTLPALKALGYKGAEELLNTPITDADGVEAWTDSIFNACVPMGRGNHQGVLPKVPPGEHHYPWPVKGADFIKYDDFQLWVTLPDGMHGAVVPVDRRGSGDGHVRLVHVPEGSQGEESFVRAQEVGKMAVLPPNSSAALQAFKSQIEDGRRTASGPLSSHDGHRGARRS